MFTVPERAHSVPHKPSVMMEELEWQIRVLEECERVQECVKRYLEIQLCRAVCIPSPECGAAFHRLYQMWRVVYVPWAGIDLCVNVPDVMCVTLAYLWMGMKPQTLHETDVPDDAALWVEWRTCQMEWHHKGRERSLVWARQLSRVWEYFSWCVCRRWCFDPIEEVHEVDSFFHERYENRTRVLAETNAGEETKGEQKKLGRRHVFQAGVRVLFMMAEMLRFFSEHEVNVRRNSVCL